MSPISEAQKRATQKYEGTQEFIQFRVPKGNKALYSNHAKNCGESLTTFFRRAAAETMERDLSQQKADTDA